MKPEGNKSQFSDEAILLKFVKTLPENKVRNFKDWLANGEYNDHHSELFTSYSTYSEDVLSGFNDQTLNDKYKKFNQAFNKLFGFLSSHFFRVTPESSIFALYPEMRHSKKVKFGTNQTEEQFWDKQCSELQELANNFQNDYLSVLKTARQTMSDGDKRQIVEEKDGNKVQNEKYPSDLRWEEITIRFLDGQEAQIKYRGILKHTDYEEMGFKNHKNNEPNKQWEFLTALAGLEGEINWENNSKFSLKQIGAVQKQKQLLAEKLESYFGISNDPFYDYKKEKSYRIKLQLIPEIDSAKNPHIPEEDSDDRLGVKEYFNKQAPLINDQ